MKKKLLALLLAGVLLVGSAGAAFTATKTYTPGQFTDVAANVWYAASVQKVYELGLMSGSSATTFNPNGMFTVAEALTVAGRMHSLAHGGNGVLPAAAGAWYQGAVNYCLQNKLITADQFDSYTRSATRSEMAGVIRAALPDDQWKAINSVSALPDVNMGNEYAQAIFDLYNAGVFTGSDEYGMFQPYAYITRAEVAAIVARCADPSQRKTLSLTPLSQRQAPELIGGYQSNVKMSNGRLAYQDPNTGKWGYLDGKGTAVIPAQYDYAEAFESGYAKVGKNWKYGLINTAGAVVLPVEQDQLTHADERNYDPAIWFATKNGNTAIVNNGRLVTGYIYDSIKFFGGVKDVCAVRQNDKWGIVNSAGGTIVPIKYPTPRYGDAVAFTGDYGFGCPAEGGVDVYDLNGALLGHFAEGCYYAIGNPLLAVKEGNKYAVATPKGKITEAVYDSVKLAVDSPYAEVKYGDLTGLVGLNGELIALGTYDCYAFDGRYFAAYKETVKSTYSYFYQVAVGDATGVLYTGTYDAGYPDRAFLSFRPGINEDAGLFYCGIKHWYRDSDSEGLLFQNDGQYKKAYFEDYDNTFRWSDSDGKHSVPVYRRSTIEKYTYTISKNDAGKPIVAYGNDTIGWTPVIEYYKNNMYYDEIKDIGEGYYACRFNTTWYLVHA